MCSVRLSTIMVTCDSPTCLSKSKKQSVVGVQKTYFIFRPIHIPSKTVLCFSANGSQEALHIVPDVGRKCADEE
jgi:hypothetical protein